MDKTIFYRMLDIDKPSDFEYYENLETLLEADDYIEANLINDLYKDVEPSVLAELYNNYFEEFLKNIPDEESDFYIMVENISRVFQGLINNDMDEGQIAALADETIKFRKWYVFDNNAFDMNKGIETNIRDARYDILAAKLLGEKCKFDFRTALDYELDGYDINIQDLVYEENEIDKDN